jgi:diadenosine tetraphosphate (Ap4A) HIT family hydrolase
MSEGDTLIHRRVAALQAGQDPAFVGRMKSGWVILGDPQVIEGYCLLLPDPVVPHLNALDGSDRLQFLADMAQVGDVLLAELGARRINYAIFGNVEPALHAHVFPRRADEAPECVTAQPWALDWAGAPAFNPGTSLSLLMRLREAFATSTAG